MSALLVEASDAGVLQGGQDLPLAMEAAHPGLAGIRAIEQLERDPAHEAVALLFGQVDPSMPPRPISSTTR
jgi:hypothetical protein